MPQSENRLRELAYAIYSMLEGYAVDPGNLYEILEEFGFVNSYNEWIEDD
jgi:hypothetical protein